MQVMRPPGMSVADRDNTENTEERGERSNDMRNPDCAAGVHTGKDSIASDVSLCFLNGNQLGQIVDCCLTGTVGNLGNVRHKATNRGNVDDTAAMICHMLDRSLACQKDASQV